MIDPSDKKISILVVEDDPDDRMLIKEAFFASRITHELDFVNDGIELLDYLLHREEYTDAQRYPTPSLILLDLNTPRMDGREVLRTIKSDPAFKSIPVVVLTTSSDEDDIARSYKDGANSFITKPVSLGKFVQAIQAINAYWFQLVEHPKDTPEQPND